jgi:membrane-bound serine protease (ClpP class)
MLLVLANPLVAFLLLVVGIFGLLVEFSAPGTGVGGVVGAIAFVLSLIGLFSLRANFAGLLLIGLAIVLFFLEVQTTTHGVLTVGGVLAFILGTLLLYSTASAGLPWFIIVGVGLALGLLFTFMAGIGWRARRAPVTTGKEALVGQVAEVRKALRPEGQVFVWGSLWRAVSLGGFVAVGQRVRVERVEGLTLYVRPE